MSDNKFHAQGLWQSLINKADEDYLEILKELLVGQVIKATVHQLNDPKGMGHWKKAKISVKEVRYETGNGEFTVVSPTGHHYIVLNTEWIVISNKPVGLAK